MTAPTPTEVTALLYRAYLAGRADGSREHTDYTPALPPPATTADYVTRRTAAMAARRADLARIRAPKHPWCPGPGPCPDLTRTMPTYEMCAASWGTDW